MGDPQPPRPALPASTSVIAALRFLVRWRIASSPARKCIPAAAAALLLALRQIARSKECDHERESPSRSCWNVAGKFAVLHAVLDEPRVQEIAAPARARRGYVLLHARRAQDSRWHVGPVVRQCRPLPQANRR